MSGVWPEERAFRAALRDLSTSASRVTAAARLALHDPSHARDAVAVLERYMREAPAAQKLPLLYVVNQICRTASQKLGAHEPFTALLLPRIGDMVRAAMADCPPADQGAVKRTVRLWVEGKFFPGDQLMQLIGEAVPRAAIPPEPKTPPGPPPPLRPSVNQSVAPPAVQVPAPYFSSSSSSTASANAVPVPAASPYGVPPLPHASSSPAMPSFPLVPLYPQVPMHSAPPPAQVWAAYQQSAFDYGDEQDEEERLAEQKRRRIQEERRVNEAASSAPPAPTAAAAAVVAAAANSSQQAGPSSSTYPSSSPTPPSGPYPPEMYHHHHHMQMGMPMGGAPPAPMSAPGVPDGGAYYSVTLFVGRLPPGTPREELQRRFETFGRVIRVVVPMGKDHGFITFTSRQEAEEARRNMDGTPFLPGAQPMRIGWGREGVPPHLAPFFDTNTGIAQEGVMPRRAPGAAGAHQMQGWAAYEGR